MIRLKNNIRTVLVMFVCVSLVFAMTPKASAATNSLSIPTVSWDLTVTNAMAAAGITTDAANRQGHYIYSAYVNGYKLYSNYHFHPQHPYRFVFDGTEMHSVNQEYRAGMASMDTGISYDFPVPANHTYFRYDFFYQNKRLQGNAYFFINAASSGASVSISGTVTTY